MRWILLLYLSLFSSGLGLTWLYFNWQVIGSFWSAFIVGIVLGSLYFIGKKNEQKKA